MSGTTGTLPPAGPTLPAVSASPAQARTLPVLAWASQSVRPPVLPALVWPSADPEDVLDYALDFSLSLLPGEQIFSATVLQEPTTVTVSAPNYSLNPFLLTVTIVWFWISGPVDKTLYNVSVKVVTTGGRTLHIGATLPVAARAIPTPLSTPGEAP